MTRLACAALLVALTGCPEPHVRIYKSLSEPGAMQTCDANTRFRAETDGADEHAARKAGAAEIRRTVRANHGCAAFVFNEGAGSKLDGGFHYAADFQLCRCP